MHSSAPSYTGVPCIGATSGCPHSAALIRKRSWHVHGVGIVSVPGRTSRRPVVIDSPTPRLPDSPGLTRPGAVAAAAGTPRLRSDQLTRGAASGRCRQSHAGGNRVRLRRWRRCPRCRSRLSGAVGRPARVLTDDAGAGALGRYPDVAPSAVLRLADCYCRGSGGGVPVPPQGPADGAPALLMLSSGSTGTAMSIPLSHAGLREFARGPRQPAQPAGAGVAERGTQAEVAAPRSESRPAPL